MSVSTGVFDNLYYEITEAAGGRIACITGLKGLAWEVRIPEEIEGCPVTVIGKKAFLSRKNLRKVTVPAAVEEIRDWAFAYCDSLETVALCGNSEDRPADETAKAHGLTEKGTADMHFGRSVFLDCTKLKFLYAGGKNEGTAALLAAAVTTAEAPYLLDVREAGSPEWLNKWDARMMAILSSPDNEGYSKQVLCGEEDYGSTDLNAYESGRRRVKVRLLMLRLLYPEGLLPERKALLEQYLLEHTKGCVHEETWRVTLEEHGEDRVWYQLFAELGCVREDNFEALLADIGEDCPEMKAYLMRFKEERIGYTDFFAGLEL